MLPAPITPRRWPSARTSAGRLPGDGRRPLEAVEAGGIVPEDPPLRPPRERGHADELADRARELAVAVRIVAAQHDQLVPQGLDPALRATPVHLRRPDRPGR